MILRRLSKTVCVMRKDKVIRYLNTVSISKPYAKALNEGVLTKPLHTNIRALRIQGTTTLSSHRGDTIASSLATLKLAGQEV